jgi:glycine/D-amino acid oxidase-like deaminating enzyme
MASEKRARREFRRDAGPNQSFWLEAIDTENLEPPLEGSRQADVVLLGGGYTSLVAACSIKRARPDKEVALLEAEYVGFGASGRNAGMVLHDLHAERVRDAGESAVRFTYDQTVSIVDLIEETATEGGFDCELERSGYLSIAFYPAHLRWLAKEHQAARALGVDLPLWDRERVRAAIGSDRFVGALVHPRAATLHPGKYVSGLKRAALRAGVKVYERSPALEVRPGNEIEIRTEAGKVTAAHLILGLNAYLPASRLGLLRDRAVSLKSFILLTEPLAEEYWKEIGWRGREGYSDLRRVHNYVRLTGKRILFGGRVLYHFGVGSPEQEESIYARLHRELLGTFPALTDVRITHRWNGPVALTRRRTPTVGRLGRSGNIYYALGYSGMGVSLGTLSGRVVADLVLGEGSRWKDLIYLRDRPWPLPPEPLRFLGFKASYHGMRLLDALDAWRR